MTLWEWVEKKGMGDLRKEIDCHIRQFVDADSDGQYQDALSRCVFISLRQWFETGPNPADITKKD